MIMTKTEFIEFVDSAHIKFPETSELLRDRNITPCKEYSALVFPNGSKTYSNIKLKPDTFLVIIMDDSHMEQTMVLSYDKVDIDYKLEPVINLREQRRLMKSRLEKVQNELDNRVFKKEPNTKEERNAYYINVIKSIMAEKHAYFENSDELEISPVRPFMNQQSFNVELESRLFGHFSHKFIIIRG